LTHRRSLRRYAHGVTNSKIFVDKLGDIAVDVVQKDIKNIHLSVHPPTGAVRISAPLRMNLETIRVYAISRLGWIKQHQEKLRRQEAE
jgi:predicted metal-dependent hydrolase